MSLDVEDPPERTAASLVSGILGDLHHLVQQQFELTRREVEVELRQYAAAAVVFGLGAAMLLVAGLVFGLTFSHLLHWAASPPGTEPAWFPLWACHAVVAAVFAVIGAILVLVGRAKFRCTEEYQNPATEILQEPVKWPTHPK